MWGDGTLSHISVLKTLTSTHTNSWHTKSPHRDQTPSHFRSLESWIRRNRFNVASSGWLVHQHWSVKFPLVNQKMSTKEVAKIWKNCFESSWSYCSSPCSSTRKNVNEDFYFTVSAPFEPRKRMIYCEYLSFKQSPIRSTLTLRPLMEEKIIFLKFLLSISEKMVTFTVEMYYFCQNLYVI